MGVVFGMISLFKFCFFDTFCLFVTMDSLIDDFFELGIGLEVAMFDICPLVIGAETTLRSSSYFLILTGG